jgi:hypothetical protein
LDREGTRQLILQHDGGYPELLLYFCIDCPSPPRIQCSPSSVEGSDIDS